MDGDVRRAWEEFLDPEVTRPRLISASIYIAAFEVLKDLIIVGRIRDFFSTGFNESGEQTDPKYQSDVLSRNRSPTHASLAWLIDREAIDESDVQAFDRAKACRNRLAHDLFSMLGSKGLPPDFDQCCAEMIALVRKIEVWWVTNVEIPTNPDYDGCDIDEEGIVPGLLMGIQLLCDIAQGDEERSRFYFDEFRKSFQGGEQPDAADGLGN